MRARAWFVVHAVVVAAGCGVSAAEDAAPKARAGHDLHGGDGGGPVAVPATVHGIALNPISALAGSPNGYGWVFTRVDGVHTAVEITDFADHCGSEDQPFGRSLYFDLFDELSATDARAKAPGRFEAWSPGINGDMPIPSGHRVVALVAELSETAAGIIRRADSGNVTLTGVATDRITGTFALDFRDASEDLGDVELAKAFQVTGSFEAPICAGSWHRSGTVP